MTVKAPKEFKLADNRPATYVQTLDQVIKMGPSLVMVIIPNNKVINRAIDVCDLNESLFS